LHEVERLALSFQRKKLRRKDGGKECRTAGRVEPGCTKFPRRNGPIVKKKNERRATMKSNKGESLIDEQKKGGVLFD